MVLSLFDILFLQLSQSTLHVFFKWLKSTLTQTQEKAIRKISELKEQLLVTSEENKELVKVLQTQVGENG